MTLVHGQLISSKFCKHHLSDVEELQGSIFSEGQRYVIQNKLAALAEEKLLLDYDVADPTAFIQLEAVYKGKIEILTHLLEDSDACSKTLYEPDPEPDLDNFEFNPEDY